MSRCLCLKPDGKQCTRNATIKANNDSNFCWQHQNCKKNIGENDPPKISVPIQLKSKPKIPLKSQPKNPAKSKPTTPLKSQPKNPSKSTPTTPLKSQPKKPVKLKPTTPLKSQPKNPLKSQPKIPLKLQSKNPLKSQPKIPIKSQPKIPLKLQPIKPLGSQPKRLLKSQPKLPEFKHPSRQLRILSGSTIFAFYPNINGRRILLLGEVHNNKGICSGPSDPSIGLYELHDWFDELSLNAPECLDIFIEQSYMLPQSQVGGWTSLSKYGSPLYAIKQRFKNCHVYQVQQKEKCHSNFLRYHYVDTRGYKSVAKTPYLEWYLSGYEVNKANHILNQKYWDQRELLYRYMLTMNRTSEAERLYNNYIADMAIIIGVSYDPSKYKQYMEIYYKNIDKEIVKLDPNLDKEKFFESLLSVYMFEKIIGTSLFIMPQDVYFLLRLFTVFDEKKMNRGPIECRNQQYQIIKNAIFHGGLHHTRIYMQFIKTHFGISPTIDIMLPMSDKCVKLNSPFDFFGNN